MLLGEQTKRMNGTEKRNRTKFSQISKYQPNQKKKTALNAGKYERRNISRFLWNTHTLSHTIAVYPLNIWNPERDIMFALQVCRPNVFFFYFSGACLPKVSNYQMQILHNNCWCVCVCSFVCINIQFIFVIRDYGR